MEWGAGTDPHRAQESARNFWGSERNALTFFGNIYPQVGFVRLLIQHSFDVNRRRRCADAIRLGVGQGMTLRSSPWDPYLRDMTCCRIGLAIAALYSFALYSVRIELSLGEKKTLLKARF